MYFRKISMHLGKGVSLDVLANPREGTQDRNDDENIGDDAANNHSRVLYRPIPYNVNDLEHEPPRDHVSAIRMEAGADLPGAG
jgi:hypothetical protein